MLPPLRGVGASCYGQLGCAPPEDNNYAANCCADDNPPTRLHGDFRSRAIRPSTVDTMPQYPISTREAARLLHATESQLAELVRRDRLDPSPVVISGRRLWYAPHVRSAAQELLRKSRRQYDQAALEAVLAQLSTPPRSLS